MKQAALTILTTFTLAIAAGTALLLLPISTHSGSISVEDACFTATSAVTVTGLIVVDTATAFTRFGQTVILLLLQFGGLGFMTFSTLIILLTGKSISVSGSMMLENDFTPGRYRNLRDLVTKIFLLTLGLELLGTAVLFLQLRGMNTADRLFSAVFHSISAFCNAGFSIFSNSFEDFTGDLGINATLSLLIVCGGIGFLVLNEIYLFVRRRIARVSRFSLHTKLVVSVSIILTLGGFLVILLQELGQPQNTLPLGEKILAALFQSVTARTAGFNTVNLNVLSAASVWVILFLMFIGASPGSTGGGVKTSTAGMALAYVRARLRGREGIDLFYRRIPGPTIEKAFTVINLSFLLISVSVLLLLTFERSTPLTDILFEAVSAFGTVGLSMGITPALSLGSKITIMLTMFIGRIGPLTLLIALSRRESRAVYDYPRENVMIG